MITRSYVLRGHYAGKTIQLRDFAFVRGVYVATATSETHTLIQRVVAQWGATEVHDGDIGAQEEGAGDVGGEVRPDDGQAPKAADGVDGGGAPVGACDDAGHVVPEGDRQAEAVDPKLKKIAEAVARLDTKNPAHWARGGKPDLATVEKLAGFSGITRAMVNAVAPDARRTK